MECIERSTTLHTSVRLALMVLPRCSHRYSDSPGADNVILLTSTRVLSFWSRKLRLEWDLPFSLIQGVTVEDTGIRFASKQGKEHDKFAFIPEKTAQSWFFNQVASVVRVYNARRRMDS